MVLSDTLEIGEAAGTVQALIVNTESEDPANPVKFRLEIFTLDGGIFRFKINEAYPIKERVEVSMHISGALLKCRGPFSLTTAIVCHHIHPKSF